MLGYISERVLKELSKRKIHNDNKLEKLSFYDHCIFGQMKRMKFTPTNLNGCDILNYVHLDLQGLEMTLLEDGSRYILTIIANFSRRLWVYLRKSKDETFQKFIQGKNLVLTQTEKKFKCLKTDNGLGFAKRLSQAFVERIISEGI